MYVSTWILILWLSYPGYNNAFSQGGLATAEFNSQDNCQIALKTIREVNAVRGKRAFKSYVNGICVEQ